MENLIIDTNAFLHNFSKVQNCALDKQIYTTYSVLEEIKEKEVRQKIRTFLPNLRFKNPTKKSMKILRSFAKKTGDFVSLSKTDLEVIALAVDVIEENG